MKKIDAAKTEPPCSETLGDILVELFELYPESLEAFEVGWGQEPRYFTDDFVAGPGVERNEDGEDTSPVVGPQRS